MRSLIAAIVFTLAAWMPAVAKEPPKAFGAWKMRLPESVNRCLASSAKNFAPWTAAHFFPPAVEAYPHAAHQTPSTLLGDFDGDGATDAALYGRRKDKIEILVVFSSGERCETKTLLSTPYENPAKIRVHFGDKSGYGLTTTLERYSPGKYSSAHEKSPLTLKHDAVVVRHFGKAATLYHYANGGFASFALED